MLDLTDPTTAALVAECAARPDEHTVALALADHLQERGDDARAEFIRVQCELEATNQAVVTVVRATPGGYQWEAPEYARVDELIRREADLSDRYATQLSPDVPYVTCDGFRRGLLSVVRARLADVFLRYCPGCGGAAPYGEYITCKCDYARPVEWRPTDRAAAWVRRFPTLERVFLTDRTPAGTAPDSYSWFGPSATLTDNQHRLPGVLWFELPHVSYPSLDAAHTALARAVVRVLRKELSHRRAQ